MRQQWKVALCILVLCAVCLLLGKYLRILSGKEGAESGTGKKTGQEDGPKGAPGEGEGTKGGTKDKGAEGEGMPTAPGQEIAGQLSPEQQLALNGFDAKGKVIVLDAGHGGFDPGKVGVNGAKEKEINLQIANVLKKYLEAAGFQVVMTRTGDEGLYSEGDANKKAADMKARVRMMQENQPEFAVSIHQNSFTQESSFGAQVFYYEGSKKGKALAEVLQNTLREALADGNYREPKANASYYLLKKSPCPLVIVECGFLSNYREAELLVTSEYQDKMAWAICLGIVNYCNTEEKEE